MPIETLKRLSRRGFARVALAGASLVTARSAAVPPFRRSSWQEPRELKTRRIWLRLLLDQVKGRLDQRQPLAEAERFLAGLIRVRFLYVDESSRDIILEGPAEDAWQVGDDGRALGAKSGQPLLQLDDFAVAWRNAAGGQPPPSVSLEQKPESVARVREFIQGTPRPTTPAGRKNYATKLQEAWGEQDVVTRGVPLDSRFNKLMADADWEMKRISLGQADSPVKLESYVDREFAEFRRRVETDGATARGPQGGSRFWFFPAYSEFPRTEKFDAVAIPDDPVQLLTEGRFRDVARGDVAAQPASDAAQRFADDFSRLFNAIAELAPLHAELRNLFDWVAVARLIQLFDAPRRIGDDLATLRDRVPVAKWPVPATMPGLVALRHAQVRTDQGDANLLFPARGGVSIDVGDALSAERFRIDPALAGRRAEAVRARAGAAGWWR